MTTQKSSPEGARPEDQTGRDRFTRNVVFTWGAYLVYVVAGFIMPRMISDQLGQTMLGIWDFSWSVVAYFGLLQLGLGGSINRYVAQHRAAGDTEGLNRSVSTIILFLRLVGLVILLVSLLTAWLILPFFAPSLGSGLAASQWVVLILGVNLALCISFSAYGAVMVGCHRWDIHNSISAVTHGLSVLCMIVVLLLGGGLPALALSLSVLQVSGELVRWRIAGRVCPELAVHHHLASWRVFVEQARYSAKTLVPRIADLISGQTMLIMITIFIGPASLAVFARPRNLVLTLRTMAAKFGAILVPTASSLQASEDRSSLQETLKTAPAALSSLTLPAVIVLAILGDDIIRIWMGNDYVHPGLATILAVGIYPMLVQEPIWSILAGMNIHGRIALLQLYGAVAAAALLAVGLMLLNWGLLGAAICFTLPRILLDGLATPLYACRRLGVSLRSFYHYSYLRPCLCAAPFAAALLGARVLAEDSLGMAIALSIPGIVLSVILYWTFLTPRKVRQRVVLFLHFGCLKKHPRSCA